MSLNLQAVFNRSSLVYIPLRKGLTSLRTFYECGGGSHVSIFVRITALENPIYRK